MIGRCSILLCCLGLSVGCNKLVPVEGRVTLDGQPVERAQVALIPEATSKRRPAPQLGTGLTDKEGMFRLETINKTGAAPGQYRVTVSKKVLPAGVPRPKTSEEAMRVRHLYQEMIPAHYTDAGKTPLSVDIPRGGRKDIEIELKSRRSGAEK